MRSLWNLIPISEFSGLKSSTLGESRLISTGETASILKASLNGDAPVADLGVVQ